MLLALLFPAVLQEDCGTTRTWNLSTLEIEAAGLDRVVGFDEFTHAYDIWTTTGVDTIVVRAESVATTADVFFELSFGGPVTSGDLGVGGGQVTLNIPPDTTGLLRIGVRVRGITTFHEINLNPPCGAVACNDANPCTGDVCNVSTCEFAPVANGASCPIALSDCTGSAPGAGTCQSGVCDAALEVCPCSATTASEAVPKECVSGKVFDPVTLTCTCEELGADVIAGGNCQESPLTIAIVGGCEASYLPNAPLQFAYRVAVFVEVISPGAGGPGTVDHRARVWIENPILPTQAGIETLDSVEVVIGSSPGGQPATLVNQLDPALAGSEIGVFSGGSPVLDLDAAILDETSAFVPAPGTDVEFFLEDLRVQFTAVPVPASYGFDISSCTFDNPGTVLEPGLPPTDGVPIVCPVQVAGP